MPMTGLNRRLPSDAQEESVPDNSSLIPCHNHRPNFFKRMQRTVSRVWEWEGTGGKDISDTERAVQRIWLTLRASTSVRRAELQPPIAKAALTHVLKFPPEQALADERGVPVDEDLMLLGGTSIKMGALASQLGALVCILACRRHVTRRAGAGHGPKLPVSLGHAGAQYGVSLSPAVLFAPPRTIRAIAAEVDALCRDAGEAPPLVTAGGGPGPDSSGAPPPAAASQFGTLPMLVQALPALMWSPLSRLVTFSGFTLLFVSTHQIFVITCPFSAQLIEDHPRSCHEHISDVELGWVPSRTW